MRAKPLATEPDSKPVGIWIRVSTEDQARGESPEHHERRAMAYVESKGWRVRETYHLEGVSGKAVSEHPETKRMLADIRSGHISGLVFSKLARLARNTKELLEFADRFREAGADLVSLQESIDTTSPAGRLFYTMIAGMAQWEREEIAERVAVSIPIRAKLGKPIAGAPPFGYHWESRQLVPHPKEAPVRTLLHELFFEHKRRKTVARLLNERGYRTRKGGLWTDTTIERLLRDPTAKGVRRANYTRSRGQGKGWDLKAERDWVLVPCPAIVSEELWTACVSILDARRTKGKRVGRPPAHLFTGLAYCHCGQKLYVPSNMPKYVCYRCRNKIKIEDLEAVFLDQLKDFFLNPDQVAQYVDQSDNVLEGKAKALDALRAEETKLRTEMDRTYRLYQADQISVEGFGHLYRPLEERQKQIEEELPRLQGEVDYLRIDTLSRADVLASGKDLTAHWPELTAEERRQIIEAMVERIDVGKDDVEFTLQYSPSPSEAVVQRQRKLRGSLPRRVEILLDSIRCGWRERSGSSHPRAAGAEDPRDDAETPGVHPEIRLPDAPG